MGFKLLIVDDMPENLRLLYHTLKDDYELFSATNGRDALKLATELRPDLVLLDIMMPDMDGYAVCKSMKDSAELCNIPVIFLTAMTEEDEEVLGFSLGAVDYITKPIKPQVVRQRVATHLELKNKRDELARKNIELEEALSRIKVLSGLLPICQYCKKIRDGKDTWQRLEDYISERSDASFSHGMCPDCFESHMKDLRHKFNDPPA